jgi:hypothetical protein
MWAISHLFLKHYAHGYGKFGNYPTSIYIALYHHSWRWLSVSNLRVWTRRLCLLEVDNTNHFGCDCRMCYSTCAEGFTFWSVIVGKLRWLDMEGPCVQLCTMSSSQCGWPNGPIFSHGSNWPTMYVVWASFRSCRHVNLWQVFSRLTYWMFRATNGRSASW